MSARADVAMVVHLGVLPASFVISPWLAGAVVTSCAGLAGVIAAADRRAARRAVPGGAR